MYWLKWEECCSWILVQTNAQPLTWFHVWNEMRSFEKCYNYGRNTEWNLIANYYRWWFYHSWCSNNIHLEFYINGPKKGNVALSTTSKEKSRPVRAKYAGIANTLFICWADLWLLVIRCWVVLGVCKNGSCFNGYFTMKWNALGCTTWIVSLCTRHLKCKVYLYQNFVRRLMEKESENNKNISMHH